MASTKWAPGDRRRGPTVNSPDSAAIAFGPRLLSPGARYRLIRELVETGTTMAANQTKQAIIDAVVAKVEAESLRSVQIAKLIKELDINRNTFYYHFTSKYDVAFYVFRTDLAQALVEAFPADELVSAPLSSDPESVQLPYYIHREIGARTLDFGDFFKTLVRCTLARPQFYSKLFDYRESEFRLLVNELYRPAVESDLKFVLGGRYMPQSTFDFFCHKYTRLVYETVAYYLKHSRDAEAMLSDAVNPFWNMPYESLVHSLQMHAIRRPRAN